MRVLGVLNNREKWNRHTIVKPFSKIHDPTQAHPVLQKGTACFHLPAIMIYLLVKISQNFTLQIFLTGHFCLGICKQILSFECKRQKGSLKIKQVVLFVYSFPLKFQQLENIFYI